METYVKQGIDDVTVIHIACVDIVVHWLVVRPNLWSLE